MTHNLLKKLLSLAVVSPNLESVEKWDSASIPSTPFMEEEGINVFAGELLRSKVFLEYGSGGSTVMASRSPGLVIHSVDSNPEFLNAVRGRCLLENPECNLSTYHVDVGPAYAWGVPSDPTKANLWPFYCIKPWVELNNKGTKPDLILVDGRFRVSCFLVSLALSPLGTVILFDDYAERSQYHTVEKHVRPESFHGRMGRFKKMTEPNLSELLLDVLAFCADPD